MIVSTRAVVIHSFSYSDTSIILKAYTEKFGYNSYLLKGYKKQRKNKVLLHPLGLIEISAVHKNDNGLYFGRSISTYLPLHEMFANPVKSSIAMFLAEWLFHTVSIGEGDSVFFNWLIQAIEKLNNENNPENFHLWFLLNLSRFMGFYPQGNRTNQTPVFNLTEGEFANTNVSGDMLTEQESNILNLLLYNDYEAIIKFELNRLTRRNMLRFFHDYFQICLNNEFNLKSFDVLLQIFDE
jgi:DNA repair protein RecO (recombination protein O)